MLSQAEFERLDALLLDLPDDDAMLLAEFDGLCAALVVCPEVIAPSEWLPLVAGEEGGLPAELGDLLLRHYNDVATALLPPTITYEPVFDEDAQFHTILWETWVLGFERGMALRPDVWTQIVESGDEEAGSCVTVMLTLFEIAQGQCALPKASIRRLSDEAPDLIPRLVLTLNSWTKTGRVPAVRPAFLRSVPTVPVASTGQKAGRNDPCPCGSGQKYKRCCGK